MYARLENVLEHLLEPLILDLSDLRLELNDREVQIDLDYGREEEVPDKFDVAPFRPAAEESSSLPR